MEIKKGKYKTIIDYLMFLPEKVVMELYEDPWICQAIFRILPFIEKQIILRMIFLNNEKEISENNIKGWIKDKKIYENSIEHLKSLHIFQEKQNIVSISSLKISKLPEEYLFFILNPKFQQQIKKTLCDINLISTELNRFHKELEKEKYISSLDKLEEYAKNAWNSLLGYMIGMETKNIPPNNIIEILIKTNLMKLVKEDICITNEGFKFLLKDIHSQLWILLLAYIEAAEKKKEVLSFLFQISFLTLGKAYSISNLTPIQILFFKDLQKLGLLYQKKETSKKFYITKLTFLLSSPSSKMLEQNKEGFIIMETNYKLYAYTNSELQISILSTFCNIIYRLPNFIMGLITRESIRKALINGISAEDIIDYLYQNAHPEMKKKIPIIPENISDQILLWEAERNRIQYNKGVLYDSFPSETIFKDVVEYAQNCGVYIWHQQEKQLLMVTEEGHDFVRQFIKKKIS